jgi:uncharacterized coiled-coil protein SlyX
VAKDPYIGKKRTSVERRIAEVEAGIAEQLQRLRYLATRAGDTSEVEAKLWALRKELAALNAEHQITTLRTASDDTPSAPAADPDSQGHG